MRSFPLQQGWSICFWHKQEHCSQNEAGPNESNLSQNEKDLHCLSEIRTHSVQRQLMMPLDAACPMKPPKTGPKTGPQNAAFANAGKAAVLSEAVHMSEILPPTQ